MHRHVCSNLACLDSEGRLSRRAFLATLALAVLGPVVAEADAVCAQCGQVIRGRSIMVDGRYYHPDHFLCDYCNQPIRDQYVKFDGGHYHEACLKVASALICDICGQPMSGRYLVDFWGDRYHEAHQAEYSPCRYCGRLMVTKFSQGGYRYKDDRLVCGICYGSSIWTKDKAEKTILTVKNKLATFGITVPIEHIPVTLVDKYVLASQGTGYPITSGHQEPDGLAKTEMVRKNGKLISQHIEVMLLYGMPLIFFERVAAHELMHVWISLFNAHGLKPYMEEGSCNVAAMLVLSTHEGKTKDYYINNMAKDPDPVYGDGYRASLQYLRKVGMTKWLRYLSGVSS